MFEYFYNKMLGKNIANNLKVYSQGNGLFNDAVFIHETIQLF